MRTIEKNILSTLSSSRAGVYNLSMRDRVEINDDEKRVYLWNHLIYSINKKDNTVMFSLCGWNSTTTKSRLNALLGYHFGAGITQKNYNLSFVVNGKKTAIDSNSIYCLNDNADIVKM
jgi:hypothetical protein